MATTNRLFQDFISFATDADPGISGVSLSAPGLADLLVVADPDFIALTLDPREVFGAPEIVWVSAHSSSATTATIVRAREGTTARTHDVGTVVIASLTAIPVAVFEHDYLDLAGTRPMTGALAMGGFGIAGVEGVDPETDVADSLGTAALTWRQLFVDNVLDRAGVIAVDVENRQLEGAWEVVGNFDPSTDVARDLGDSSLTWRRLYVDALYDRAGVSRVDVQNRNLAGNWSVVSSADVGGIGDTTVPLAIGGSGGNLMQIDGNEIQVWTDDSIATVASLILQDFGGITRFGGEIDPKVSGTLDIGSTSLRWDTIFASNPLNTSDVRLKEVLGPIRDALAAVRNIDPFEYKWKKGQSKDQEPKFGFSAQAVGPWLPQAVRGDDVLHLDPMSMVAVLWQAVRELAGR